MQNKVEKGNKLREENKVKKENKNWKIMKRIYKEYIMDI